jgi:hypothetical protein
MTLDDMAEHLEELRALDDPRTSPQRPYTTEYSHLEEKWPEIAPDGAVFRVVWKEEREKKERSSAPKQMEGETQSLFSARSLAQSRSAHPRTVAGLAWVQLDCEDEQPEPVDVWAQGYWVEPHGWTKEGVPPHRPNA